MTTTPELYSRKPVRDEWDNGTIYEYERNTAAERVIEAARKVCEDQAAIHDKSAWPQKYRAAFGAIAKLYDALSDLDKEGGAR